MGLGEEKGKKMSVASLRCHERLCQGLYLSGVIGDRVNLRYVLCFGLCGSAAVVSSLPAVVLRGPLRLSCPEPSVRLQEFVFGTVTEWLGLYNVYLYCGLWVLNGLLQSAVWPCVVAVMGNWFGKSGCVLSFHPFPKHQLLLTF